MRKSFRCEHNRGDHSMTNRQPFTAANVRLPRGVRDFLPAAATTRRAIADSVLARFDRWGYQRLITPQFEVADVLERGLGDGARRNAVRFIEPDTGGRRIFCDQTSRPKSLE